MTYFVHKFKYFLFVIRFVIYGRSVEIIIHLVILVPDDIKRF